MTSESLPRGRHSARLPVTARANVGAFTSEDQAEVYALPSLVAPRVASPPKVDGDLSGSTGAVLDPIFALRTRVRVSPGQSVSVAFTTLVATSRESAFELADRYHDSHAAQRALDFAWTSTQIWLRELSITPANAAVFQEIAAQLLFRGGTLAPPLDELRRNRGSSAGEYRTG